MVRIIPFFAFLALLLAPLRVLAHCPLCTAGAGLAAVFAAWLGVSTIVIGIFIGAFAVALGLWFAVVVKKQYIPRQRQIFGLLSFVLTIGPLWPTMRDYTSFYLSVAGDYGSLLNRTYVLNKFLLGSVVGALLMAAAPYVSLYITSKRGGKKVAYQGMIVVFGLLMVASLLIQFGL